PHSTRQTPRSVSAFLLASHPPHPSPHSFPTRRSSDLLQRQRPILVRHPRQHGRSRQKPTRYESPKGAEGNPLCLNPPQSVHTARSEEHTSELQSHLNLVCRLLLEKKKLTTLTAHTTST